MSQRWQRAGGGNPKGWRVQRARILARDGHECQLKLKGCTRVATQVDHMVPWVPGEQQNDHHLQAACAHCNASAGAPEGRDLEVERPPWLL